MFSFVLGVAFGIVYSLLCYRLYQLDKADRETLSLRVRDTSCLDNHSGQT